MIQILAESDATRLLRLRYIPNFSQTREQAESAGKRWPSGLTHRGEPPKTLRELLSDGPTVK